MTAQETRGVDDADPGRDPQQLGRVGDAGHADMYRQLDAAASHAGHPLLDHARVEAEVADDVGGDPSLVPHRLDRKVVVDEAVTLGIAGDADVAQAVLLGLHRLEEGDGVREPACRLASVAGDHEYLFCAHRGQRTEHVLEVRFIPDQPCGEVRHDRVAVPGQSLGPGRWWRRCPCEARP